MTARSIAAARQRSKIAPLKASSPSCDFGSTTALGMPASAAYRRPPAAALLETTKAISTSSRPARISSRRLRSVVPPPEISTAMRNGLLLGWAHPALSLGNHLDKNNPAANSPIFTSTASRPAGPKQSTRRRASPAGCTARNCSTADCNSSLSLTMPTAIRSVNWQPISLRRSLIARASSRAMPFAQQVRASTPWKGRRRTIALARRPSPASPEDEPASRRRRARPGRRAVRSPPCPVRATRPKLPAVRRGQQPCARAGSRLPSRGPSRFRSGSTVYVM